MSLGRRHRKPVEDLPKSVSEAVDRLVAGLSESDKALIRGMRKEEMIRFHRSLGMGIRNEYGLWGRNHALIVSLPPEQRWANASMFILDALWDRLHDGGEAGESG